MANKIHIRPNLFLPGEDTLFHHAENKLQSNWVQLTTTAGHSAATSYPQQASFSCETRKRKIQNKNTKNSHNLKAAIRKDIS